MSSGRKIAAHEGRRWTEPKRQETLFKEALRKLAANYDKDAVDTMLGGLDEYGGLPGATERLKTKAGTGLSMIERLLKRAQEDSQTLRELLGKDKQTTLDELREEPSFRSVERIRNSLPGVIAGHEKYLRQLQSYAKLASLGADIVSEVATRKGHLRPEMTRGGIIQEMNEAGNLSLREVALLRLAYKAGFQLPVSEEDLEKEYRATITALNAWKSKVETT